MKPKAIVSWSGGKDSALALHEAGQEYEVVSLLTTVTCEYDRISMHGVRTALLREQARALGYPVDVIGIPPACDNAAYEQSMRSALTSHRDKGVGHVICGDIFLEDVRRYREEKLFTVGLRGVFPLWQRDSVQLAREFIRLGFQAVLCCVDTQAVDARFTGRLFDERLLAELPAEVDPCGENGEFHSFVFDGPGFARPVEFVRGEGVLRNERFFYCDLLPGASWLAAT